MRYLITSIILLIQPFCTLSAIPFTQDLMIEGHSAYLTKDADETTEWKSLLIQQANTSLEISTGYCLGLVFENLLREVHRKLESNSTIKVHMHLFQILGFINENNIGYLEALKSLYAGRFYYVITTDSEVLKQEGKAYVSENHTKLIIVDEKYYLLGGTNLVDPLSSKDTDKYPIAHHLAGKFFPRASYDMDAIIRGPMAKKLRKEFFNLLALHDSGESIQNDTGEYYPNTTAYYPVKEEDKVCIAHFDQNSDTAHDIKAFAVIAGPRMQLHTIGNMYEQTIKNAKHSIDIGNMYFFPRKTIYEELMNAVNRNVALSVVTNGLREDSSLNNISIDMYGYINRLNYFPIMAGRHYSMWEMFSSYNADKGNTEVYELKLPSILYHKKVMTVDGRYSLIGSYNLGMKSEDAAFEVATIIDSPIIAAQMKAVLVDDQNHSEKISFKRALGWYFNPYYNITEAIEKRFMDGIML